MTYKNRHRKTCLKESNAATQATPTTSVCQISGNEYVMMALEARFLYCQYFKVVSVNFMDHFHVSFKSFLFLPIYFISSFCRL